MRRVICRPRVALETVEHRHEPVICNRLALLHRIGGKLGCIHNHCCAFEPGQQPMKFVNGRIETSGTIEINIALLCRLPRTPHADVVDIEETLTLDELSAPQIENPQDLSVARHI